MQLESDGACIIPVWTSGERLYGDKKIFSQLKESNHCFTVLHALAKGLGEYLRLQNTEWWVMTLFIEASNVRNHIFANMQQNPSLVREVIA